MQNVHACRGGRFHVVTSEITQLISLILEAVTKSCRLHFILRLICNVTSNLHEIKIEVIDFKWLWKRLKK
jgi:hypothetical protein